MKKILIVDDDADILEIVSIILKNKGYEVYTHPNGLEVPEAVINYAPDLVLLDIRLPGKLGTQICKELKEISDHPPIILFSAHAKKEEAMQCNADGFMVKPFDVGTLLKTVDHYAAWNDILVPMQFEYTQ